MASHDLEASRISDVDRDLKSLREAVNKFDFKLEKFMREMRQKVHELKQGQKELTKKAQLLVGRDLPRTPMEEREGQDSHRKLQGGHTISRLHAFMDEVDLPIFYGSSQIADFWAWVDAIEDFFEEMNPPEQIHCRLASYKLAGDAYTWWKKLQCDRISSGKEKVTAWFRMKKLLFRKFLSTTCSTKCPPKIYNSSQETEEVCAKELVAESFYPDNCSTKVHYESGSYKQCVKTGSHNPIELNRQENEDHVMHANYLIKGPVDVHSNESEELLESGSTKHVIEGLKKQTVDLKEGVGFVEGCEKDAIGSNKEVESTKERTDKFMPTRCLTEVHNESFVDNQAKVSVLMDLRSSEKEGSTYENEVADRKLSSKKHHVETITLTCLNYVSSEEKSIHKSTELELIEPEDHTDVLCDQLKKIEIEEHKGGVELKPEGLVLILHPCAPVTELRTYQLGLEHDSYQGNLSPAFFNVEQNHQPLLSAAKESTWASVGLQNKTSKLLLFHILVDAYPEVDVFLFDPGGSLCLSCKCGFANCLLSRSNTLSRWEIDTMIFSFSYKIDKENNSGSTSITVGFSARGHSTIDSNRNAPEAPAPRVFQLLQRSSYLCLTKCYFLGYNGHSAAYNDPHEVLEAVLLNRHIMDTSLLLDYGTNVIPQTYGECMSFAYSTLDFVSFLFYPEGIIHPIRARGTTLRIRVTVFHKSGDGSFDTSMNTSATRNILFLCLGVILWTYCCEKKIKRIRWGLTIATEFLSIRSSNGVQENGDFNSHVMLKNIVAKRNILCLCLWLGNRPQHFVCFMMVKLLKSRNKINDQILNGYSFSCPDDMGTTRMYCSQWYKRRMKVWFATIVGMISLRSLNDFLANRKQLKMAALLHSLGTSEISKLVVLTHKNSTTTSFMVTMDQALTYVLHSVFVCTLSIFHVFMLSNIMSAQLQWEISVDGEKEKEHKRKKMVMDVSYEWSLGYEQKPIWMRKPDEITRLEYATLFVPQCGLNLTRGRVIPWEGWNDVNNVNVGRKLIMVNIIGIIMSSSVNTLCKNRQSREPLKLFYKVVNGLDPPMDLDSACEASMWIIRVSSWTSF